MTSTGRLFIHAPNVHQGGGSVLLHALLSVLPEVGPVVLTVDARMPLPKNLRAYITVRRVAPSFGARWTAERWLARQVGEQDRVLCFGNLPPLFLLRGQVSLFIQNRYMVDDVAITGFSWKSRLRLTLERWWFVRGLPHVSRCIVQTPGMQRLLQARVSVPVVVVPFVADPQGYVRQLLIDKKPSSAGGGFLYVASGEPHKNHRALIEAWLLLAQEGLFPQLTLTLDAQAFPVLCAWFAQQVQAHQLRIVNIGAVGAEALHALYCQAEALIFPSTLESLGLPLIEARQAGLPVLASELDYVRDVLDPEQTFDPASPCSIARAVKRHLGLLEAPLPLQDATGFLLRAFGEVR